MAGAAFGPLVPIAEKIPKGVRAVVDATRVKDVWNAKTVANIERNAQQIYLDAERSGHPVDKDVAINIAVAKHQNFREEVILNKDLFMDDNVLKQIEPVKGRGSRVKQYAYDKLEEVGDKWNKFTQPITSTLRNMGYPNLARRLNEHDMNLGTNIHQNQEIAQVFSKAYGKLDENQQRLASIHINNGTLNEVKDSFDPAFIESYEGVRKLLNDIFIQKQDAGMDVGFIGNYFPRDFDYDRFAKDNGIVLSSMNKDFAKAINEKIGDGAVSESKILLLV